MFILVFIFNFLIAAWFYSSARKVGKNKFFWFSIGLFTCFFLGLLFLKFGELYLLPIEKTLSDAMQNRHLKIYLEIGTMVLISVYAYVIHNLFLKKKQA